MSNEYRVFGIPGAGKTSWLSKQIARATQKYSPDRIVVTSFTKAAAFELVSRKLPIPKSQVGTLHAHCYRLLDAPTLAETKVSDFNIEYPSWTLSKQVVNLDISGEDDPNTATVKGGDSAMARYQYCRNNLLTKDVWPTEVQQFAKVWEGFKKETQTVDFTDLIERVLEDQMKAPGGAYVGFVDEAQDLTPLQFRLVRWWGSLFDYFIVCGDDDQALYRWAGASAKSMREPAVPEENKIFLDTTWRCPKQIQQVAARWVEKISDREPKEQKTNVTHDGTAEYVPFNFRRGHTWLEYILEEVEQGNSVMALTACSYQLAPLVKELRRHGVPFANRFRKSRGDWNPLRQGKTSTAYKLSRFLEPEYGTMDDGRKLWSLHDLASWTSLCRLKGVVPHGFKAALEDAEKEAKAAKKQSEAIRMALDFIDRWSIEELMDKDLEWFLSNTKSQASQRLMYPVDVYHNYGVEALSKDPLVTVGTIHSVKGGEAETVFLSPDISRTAYRGAMTDQDVYDDVVRQFYVGITRAIKKLYIMAPAAQWHVTGFEIEEV